MPISFSKGFNPQAKISFASALKLGVISDCEYMDLELKEHRDAGKIKQKLMQHLPAGLTIFHVKEIPFDAPTAAAVINAAQYNLFVSYVPNEKSVESAVKRIMDEDNIEVVRKTKKGTKRINFRDFILSAEVQEESEGLAKIEILLSVSSQGAGRPEEFCELILRQGIAIDRDRIEIRRTGLYRVKTDGTRLTPWQIISKKDLKNLEEGEKAGSDKDEKKDSHRCR